jgi:hypothetical protein
MTNTVIINPIIEAVTTCFIGRSWKTQSSSSTTDESLPFKSGAVSSPGSIEVSPKSKILADKRVGRPASGMANLATTERLLVLDGIDIESRRYKTKTASDAQRES